MGIAKTAEPEQPLQVVTKPVVQEQVTTEWDGVPVDVYRYFSIDIGSLNNKESSQLKDIVEWSKSKCDEKTIGNIMSRISSMDHQLGYPSIGEKRWDKIWGWIKLTKTIEDLDRRREALRKKWAM